MPTQELPGVEGEGVSQKRIIALDNAIGAWRSVVEKRMNLTEEECAAREKVMEVMHAENVTVYRYLGADDEVKIVELIVGEKVKFKNPEDEKSAGEGGED